MSINGSSPLTVRAFYFIVVTIGGFFVMRLILAAQNEAFDKIRFEEKKELDKNQELSRLSLLSSPQKKVRISEMGDAKNLTKSESIKEPRNAASISSISSSSSSDSESIDHTQKRLNEPQIKTNILTNLLNKPKEKDTSNAINFNNNIQIIENYNFKHTCPNLSQKIQLLCDDEIDTFLIKYKQQSIKNSTVSPSILGSNLNASPNTKKNTLLHKYLAANLDNLKSMAVSKIKYLISEEHSGTPHYIIFNMLVYTVLVLNFIYLCMMSYPIDESRNNTIIFINTFCSSVFVVEIIFKLLVLGFRGYFKDGLNIMDFLSVSIGVIEILIVRISPSPDGKYN
jgi:hypothetical protein